MKSGRSTGKPTKAEAARFDAIREIGCIVAKKLNLGFVPAEIHHLTIGGRHGAKRRGHEFTIGLNPWSHRGVPFNGMTAAQCAELFKYSYAAHPRAFREAFGGDEALLALQNQLLEAA